MTFHSILTEKDTYNTIIEPSPEVLFKEKNSKFYGYAFPVSTEDEVKIHIEYLKKRHHGARHWCYAYQFGQLENDIAYRANDDGEPKNSAGMPIYGQIQSFHLTNVLIVVVRYFGGTKLGIGGLISAYRSTAQNVLETSKIVNKTINLNYQITFDYKNMSKVMRLIKEKNLIIVNNQALALKCQVSISVRLKDAASVFALFDAMHEIEIKKLND